MRITKFTHSCLRLEGDGILVVDPGGFSERSALTGADAVLITHEHPDHLDVEALSDALAQRPELKIFAHPDVLPKLTAFRDVVTAVEPGAAFSAAGFYPLPRRRRLLLSDLSLKVNTTRSSSILPNASAAVSCSGRITLMPKRLTIRSGSGRNLLMPLSELCRK